MRAILFSFLFVLPGLAQESLAVGGNFRELLDRHLTAIAEKHWTERAARVAAIRTPAEVAERQAYIREKILASLGGFPEKTPLNARITGSFDRQGYRVEKLIYESMPGFHVTANVYVPTGAPGPFPAVLGTAGHSSNGKASATYQHGWIAMAKSGHLVLAYDPPGQGERSEYFDPELGRSKIGIGTREHMMAGLQCLLAGSNFARYEIWDGIRGVDYLLTRRDVDPKRLAVAGNSGGGTQTAYLAALEPRLAVAAPSCYITSWEKLWFAPGPQDSEQIFAGFLKDGLNFGDFLIAFAPRPLKMMTAIRDFFPIDGARQTFAEVRRIYEVMGKAEHAGYFEYDDTHGWSKPRREATYGWFSRWLQEGPAETVEPELSTEPERNLYATPTGQLATSLKGETVQSLNQAAAESLYARRAAARASRPAELRSLVERRLGFSRPAGTPAVHFHGEVGREGYRIEKLVLDTEPGIRVPALLLTPSAGGAVKPAVIYLQPAGKAADAARGGDMEALVRAGHIVLAPDPRGWGEGGGAVRSGGYTGQYQLSMRAILVGKTLPGMQLVDVLGCFDYLASRKDVDASRIAVLGKGNGGVLAMYAAALEPRVWKAASEGAVASYLDIARAKVHEGVADILVPGVLKDFDLPDLARLIEPRVAWIVDARKPNGAPAGTGRDRPEGWSLEKVYAGWLKQ